MVSLVFFQATERYGFRKKDADAAEISGNDRSANALADALNEKM